MPKREPLSHIQTIMLDEIMLLQVQYGDFYCPTISQLEHVMNKRKNGRARSGIFHAFKELQRKGYIDVVPKTEKQLKVIWEGDD